MSQGLVVTKPDFGRYNFSDSFMRPSKAWAFKQGQSLRTETRIHSIYMNQLQLGEKNIVSVIFNPHSFGFITISSPNNLEDYQASARAWNLLNRVYDEPSIYPPSPTSGSPDVC